MLAVPRELTIVIERDEFALSEKAARQYLRYGYTDEDGIAVARNGIVQKKTIDDARMADYVWTVVGTDRHGRRTYMAGKVVKRNAEKAWFIITIHPTSGSRAGVRGGGGKVRGVPTRSAS